MNILFLTRSLTVGGSERQLAITAAGLARRGHTVTVAVLYGGGTLESLIRDSGVRLVVIGKNSRWDLRGPLSRLRRLFRTEQPDVIYPYLPTQTTLAALLLPARSAAHLVFGIRAGGMQLGH